MKEKLIIAAMLTLFVVGANFIIFSPWLAQMLGYYLLVIDGFFAVVAVVLVRLLKRREAK